MNLIFARLLGRRLTLLVCLAVMACSTGRTAAKSPISLDVLRRKGYGSVELLSWKRNQVYVPAKINGQKIKLLLDTGWGTDGITVGMNPAELQIALQKGTETSLTASGAQIARAHGIAQSIEMGNVQIQGTPIYFGFSSGEGVLGHDFLKRNNAIIDLTNLRLYLRPPGKGGRVDLGPALAAMGLAKASFAEGPLRSFVLNIEVNGVATQMALDTGADLTVLDPRFAKLASTNGWGRRDLYQVDAAGIMSPSDYAGTKTFKIGGVPIRTPTVSLAKFVGYDVTHGKVVGLLGLDVIGLNWGIIDVAQQKFYFAKAN